MIYRMLIDVVTGKEDEIATSFPMHRDKLFVGLAMTDCHEGTRVREGGDCRVVSVALQLLAMTG